MKINIKKLHLNLIRPVLFEQDFFKKLLKNEPLIIIDRGSRGVLFDPFRKLKYPKKSNYI